uniref:GyrI-like small molecule binding domain-containing protein n=2 Tax=Plectus sambesii TaxID=2011161 RepID=A0A914XNE4_9BILA
MWLLIFAIFFVCAAIYLIHSGLFEKIDVKVGPSPIAGRLTVYYKYHVGAYSKVHKLFKEVTDLLPKGATSIGIYYSDPHEVPESELKSAIGAVVAVNGKSLYSENYTAQLVRWGYEPIELPQIDRAVVAVHRFTTWLSILLAVKRVYAKILSFVKANQLRAGPAIELYTMEREGSRSQIHFVFPLELHDSFFVAELAAGDKHD